LGLTADARVRQAAVDAIGRYGTGLTGSRLLNGTLPLHAQLEELLADWVGAQAALVFTTGYAANLGLISSLVGADDTLFVDSAGHASLVDGGRFCEGTLRAFRHNRPNSLKRGLANFRAANQDGGLLVAVDGVYSMEGDVAPLGEIDVVRRTYGARLLVDEAHALGVVGPGGAGSAASVGILPDLYMGTFSKSLASCGGFIAGPAGVIDYLKVTCRPLLARAAQLRTGLRDLGFQVGGDVGNAIVPIMVGDDWEAVTLWKSLLDHGVYTNCALAPAVPRALLRTSVMATHCEADIALALKGFAAARAMVDD
jgi:8-amino-7-oxononanoate synthase